MVSIRSASNSVDPRCEAGQAIQRELRRVDRRTAHAVEAAELDQTTVRDLVPTPTAVIGLARELAA